MPKKKRELKPRIHFIREKTKQATIEDLKVVALTLPQSKLSRKSQTVRADIAVCDKPVISDCQC